MTTPTSLNSGFGWVDDGGRLVLVTAGAVMAAAAIVVQGHGTVSVLPYIAAMYVALAQLSVP